MKRGFLIIPFFVYIIVAFILGTVIGSFLNVCISRIPEDVSIVYPPSHCPECKKKLDAHDLIPLISFLLLKGSCRHCGKPISLRYPIVELTTAVILSLLLVKFGITLGFLLMSVYFILLVVISFIDIERLLIPDLLVIIGIFTGIIYSISKNSIIDSLIAISATFVLMYALELCSRMIMKKEALGDGDIKLAIMMASLLGLTSTIHAVFVASVLGLVVAALLISTKKTKREDYIPFAPFLALGAFLVVLF
jgi:leader peptidase (prepilin peptidase) / N-methyltransferase